MGELAALQLASNVILTIMTTDAGVQKYNAMMAQVRAEKRAITEADLLPLMAEEAAAKKLEQYAIDAAVAAETAIKL